MAKAKKRNRRTPKPILPAGEDFGKCSVCERPLHRTAFNSGLDAVRCVNPRCNLYREIIKRIKKE